VYITYVIINYDNFDYDTIHRRLAYLIAVIRASRSEPHTNQYYKKNGCTYVCIYVAIRRPHAHLLIAHAHIYCGKDSHRVITLNVAHQRTTRSN
jgi:hypothetical protein